MPTATRPSAATHRSRPGSVVRHATRSCRVWLEGHTEVVAGYGDPHRGQVGTVSTALNDVRPGQNLYAFDPTFGPGYVWHCHILDREDNRMMRPYLPTNQVDSGLFGAAS